MYKSTSRSYQRGLFPIQRKKIGSRKSRATKLKVGEIVWGRVIKIYDYGAIIDIDGIWGFLHISQISEQWIRHPSDVIKIDDVITIKVISNEIGKKGKASIKLSRKALFKKKHETAGHP